MWRQGYSAFFAYEGAAAAFGQERSVAADESGHPPMEWLDGTLWDSQCYEYWRYFVTDPYEVKTCH